LEASLTLPISQPRRLISPLLKYHNSHCCLSLCLIVLVFRLPPATATATNLAVAVNIEHTLPAEKFGAVSDFPTLAVAGGGIPISTTDFTDTQP